MNNTKPRLGLTRAALRFLFRVRVANHAQVSESIGVSVRDASLILCRLERMGRVKCVSRGGRGRYAKPTVFQSVE